MAPNKPVKRKRSSSLGRGPGPSIKRAVTGVATRPRPQRIRKPTQKKREADEVEVLLDEHDDQIDWPLTDIEEQGGAVEETEAVEENGVVEENGPVEDEEQFLIISSGDEEASKAIDSSRKFQVHNERKKGRNLPASANPANGVVTRKPKTPCRPRAPTPDTTKWYRHACALSKKKNMFIDDEASDGEGDNFTSHKPEEEEYDRDDFVVSDSEKEPTPPPKQDRRKGKERQPESDHETMSLLIARNPAVINGILDVALQDSELQELYNDLATQALPSQQLKGIMTFRQYSGFSNPGHVDPKQFDYFKDCVYFRDPVSGLPDIPAVFMIPAVCLKSELNKEFDPDASYADSFAKKIYVKTFNQEYRLLEAACGEFTSSSVLHGPLSSDGAMIFSTKKKRWARKPDVKSKSAFEEDDGNEPGPSKAASKTSLEAYPSYLLYNEEVPIYDGLACPAVSHTGFNARPGHLATFQKLPKLNPREVEPETLVMVGFTISKFPVLPETVFPTIFFNVLFVIVVAEPVSRA
ncbi:hypothetical protein VNI00_018558 [Paramarasmius palmivorus]|uniref:Uncharacterized protein n=1 Tax=Paramarasmius palmivorus TaxID=297713 RepID=A0AAW0AYT0_9AGAR